MLKGRTRVNNLRAPVRALYVMHRLVHPDICMRWGKNHSTSKRCNYCSILSGMVRNR